MKTDFLISGPSYTMFSPKAEIQKSVNCCRQKVETGLGAGAFVLVRSPSLIAQMVPISMIPGTYRGGFELNESMFLLKDTVLYILDGNLAIIGTVTGISNLENQAVHLAHNQDHTMFVSDHILYRAALAAGIGQVVETPAWPSDAPPQDVAFIQGYWVAVDASTRLWFSSDNGVTWDGLDFEDIPGTGGSNNVAVIEHLNVLYVYTARSVVPFIVGPNPNAPLVPQTSGIIVYGLLAHASLQALGNSRYWLGRNKDGENVIYRGQGYSVQKVSDLGVDNAIASYARNVRLEESTAMVYLQGGQEFYRITFPDAPIRPGAGHTWEFNSTLGEWNELSWTDFRTGETQRHRATVLVSAFSKIYAGDWGNGYLYELAPFQDISGVGKIVTDAGFPIFGNRRAPHVVGESDHRVYYDELVLLAETGLGLLQPLWLSNYRFDRDTFLQQLAQTPGLTPEQQTMLTAIYDQTPYVPYAVPYPDADTMRRLGFDPWGATAHFADGSYAGDPPMIGMAYSNDGGISYKARLQRSLGRAGEYRMVRWMRQGIARDRVYDFTWNHPCVQNLTTSWLNDPQQTPS